MTDQTPSPVSLDDKRDALRARIEAAERRNAERSVAGQAREVARSAADYTRAHPLTVIGGAVALGLAIGLLTRPGQRAARKAGEAISDAASSAKSGLRGATTRGGSKIGQVIGETVMAYVMTALDELLETARAGQDKAAEIGDAAGGRARKLTSDASDAAGAAADSTRELVRKGADIAVGVVRDLRRKTRV